MKSKLLGTIVAGALAGVLMSGTAVAEDKKAKDKAAPAAEDKKAKGKAAAKPAKKEAAGSCWHTCKGHATCAADGSSCAGQNGCAGKGQNNPKCAEAKDKKACNAVKGEGDKALCKWK